MQSSVFAERFWCCVTLCVGVFLILCKEHTKEEAHKEREHKKSRTDKWLVCIYGVEANGGGEKVDMVCGVRCVKEP